MNANTEEYLEALYTLTQDGQTASTTDIARRLKITPASVTEMLKKLADKGYVAYSPYQGATLTRQGFEIAEKMARKHRLLERFLHDVLKVGNDRVHQEACEMEHALSDEAERSLCQVLRAPDRCPDDANLIPPCNLDFSDCSECQKWGSDNLEQVGKRQKEVIAVSKLAQNQEGKVVFVRGSGKVLRRLLEMGLTTGTRVKVNCIAPLKGPVEISVRGSKLALGDEVACNVFVERIADGVNG